MKEKAENQWKHCKERKEDTKGKSVDPLTQTSGVHTEFSQLNIKIQMCYRYNKITTNSKLTEHVLTVA